jgi:hypothetical protein
VVEVKVKKMVMGDAVGRDEGGRVYRIVGIFGLGGCVEMLMIRSRGSIWRKGESASGLA